MRRTRALRLTLYSFVLNITYALYNGYLGLAGNSWWYLTLGVYYSLLSAIRFSLLLVKNKGVKEGGTEMFAKRMTGIFLICLSFCLVGTVILSCVHSRGTQHHEIVMITIALYTFLKVTFAVLNLVKDKKGNSSVLLALRNVSFADALVSVFSLQRSMLVTFQGMAEGDVQLFNLLTGSFVCLFVFLFGVNLCIKKERKRKMAKSKLVEVNKKIAEKTVEGYKKIESAVVDGYTKVEDTVVKGYTKIEDKFIDAYLTREGETLEEAKKRLKENR